MVGAGDRPDQETELKHGRLLRDCDAAHGVSGILEVVMQSAVHASQGNFYMTSKLGITVAVDLSSESALVSPVGQLTVRNVASLIAVARRAGSVGPGLDTGVVQGELTNPPPGAGAMISD